ncbi:DUF167 domain-containing protein, partial [Candidatus Parvarchaeota archaeon]|nr:DUF167 domain-containing protein [Candidatus Parvarchaeota archaeon]
AGRITVCVKSGREGNRANCELIERLCRLLGCDVKVASGAKSASKVLEIGCTEEEFSKKTGIMIENGDLYGQNIH